MEDYDGYVPGETPVYFACLPEDLNKSIPGFKEYQTVTGMEQTDLLCIPLRNRFQAYFDYILCAPVNLVQDERWYEMSTDPRIPEMPCYPADDCIAMIDNTLVVKLG